MALKRRIEQTGVPYVNADQLIEDATHIQLEEEDNTWVLLELFFNFNNFNDDHKKKLFLSISNSANTPGSPSTELTYLLNQIVTSEPASNNTSGSLRENLQNSDATQDKDIQKNAPTAIAEETSSERRQDSAMCSKTDKTGKSKNWKML